ncbi:MAG: hypothetical protein LBQ67_05390, partial [Treponema sp.]|nr:hypothetical protein [Treponema sp.]
KINEIIEQEEGIAMASEVLMSISKDEVERARLMSEYKYVVDTQSKVVQARREGRLEGEQKGRREGEQKGRQEGERKGRLAVARSLKAMGDSPEKIERVTGLSPDEIAKL